MDQEDYRPEEHSERAEEQPAERIGDEQGAQRQEQGNGKVGALRAGKAWNTNRRPRDTRPKSRNGK